MRRNFLVEERRRHGLFCKEDVSGGGGGSRNINRYDRTGGFGYKFLYLIFIKFF